MAILPILDTATAEPVKVTRAAGYVVVSRWTDGIGQDETLQYDHFDHLNDAADGYTEYARGEFQRATAVGIFPCDERGMPIGVPLDAHTLAQLVRETRAA